MDKPKTKKQVSPMMRQYLEIKEQHKNHLLFFRLGDFYELFFQDAITVSHELELTLTGKECGMEKRAPMCGIPYHSVENYIKKLIDRGYKIAICEQIESTTDTKGLVKRDVVRVITPGTVADSNLLEDGKNNYICCVLVKDNTFGICFADISTGTMHATQIESKNISLDIINELERYSPAELLYNAELVELTEVGKYLREFARCTGELIEDSKYSSKQAYTYIEQQFGTVASEIKASPICLLSLGILIDYLRETQKEGIKRLIDLKFYDDRKFMGLDSCARRNLELTHTIRSHEKRGSLLWVLDHTQTAMGKRKIRKVIEQPLIDKEKILGRQQAIEELLKKPTSREKITNILSDVYDLERLMTKVIYRSVTPRELRSLSSTLGQLPGLKKLLSEFSASILQELNNNISALHEIYQLLEQSIADDPPATLKDGGVIHQGFHNELDELRDIKENAKQIIIAMEAAEKKRTGIPKLKIGYNHVFGYTIDVSKNYLDRVPDNYIRRQTLTSSERFITTELKEYEQKVLTARERILAIETELFEEIRSFVAERLLPMQKTAEAIAMLDVLCSLAVVAQQNKYTCPEICSSGEIKITEGRHPVVEAISDRPFVPNDTCLDNIDNKVMLITGPNMAGKSTYMRQTAIIVLLAQIGSFVPATSAKVSIVDKIFTRVGAADDLSAGQSTFMVEMSEVAGILENATSNSLIILDEIGRGTSTFDGMSIAKAVVEYILQAPKLGTKTLFATHYHELTSMETELSGVVNYNIAAKKRGDNITFLRKIIKGGADDSYGIAVAKLAGLPDQVIQRANEILVGLEENTFAPSCIDVQKRIDDLKSASLKAHTHPLVEKIQNMPVDALTPIEAMNVLYDLKKEADQFAAENDT